jgi:hypothetical protein
MKIYRFNIGKNKKYFGWAVKFNFYFFTLKFERVGFKHNFMWRIELQNFGE